MTYTATAPAMMPATAATAGSSTTAARFAGRRLGHFVFTLRSRHDKPHVGRALRRRPRRHHGRDQRVDRFRPEALPPGHRGVEGPCPHARGPGHHRGRPSRKDRCRSRHDPARDRSGRVHLHARPRGHPHPCRGAADRADRPPRPAGSTRRARGTTRSPPISACSSATPSTGSTPGSATSSLGARREGARPMPAR